MGASSPHSYEYNGLRLECQHPTRFFLQVAAVREVRVSPFIMKNSKNYGIIQQIHPYTQLKSV